MPRQAATSDANGQLPRLYVRVRLALDRFELRAELETRTRVTGVFGSSGCGKTSLLETICGLRRRAKGMIRLGDDVWLDSKEKLFQRPERRNIGYVPQEGLLFPHRSVRDNLLAGKRRALSNNHPLEQTLQTAIDLLELTPLLERPASTLSGGERQRVALGRAICSGPRLLLLDEPLASLDLPLRRRLLPFLKRVRDEFEVPMLLVSHDPIEILALCDDVIVLRDGSQIARGEPRAVLTDPDIFPLADKAGFENILPYRIASHGDGTTVVRLESQGKHVELVTLAASGAEGDKGLVGIPAHEIILATERPHGLSARNVLPARITDMRSTGAASLVTAELLAGLPPVTVEVTERTLVDMGLEKGGEIYLVVKAASCRLYESGS